MAWKFKPKAVKEGFFTGHILVEFPGYEARSKIIRSMGFDVGNTADLENLKAEPGKALDLQDKLIVAARERIKEVALVRVADEDTEAYEVKSLEDLEANPELANALAEVGAFLIGGVTLSKKPSTLSESK